MEEPQGAPSATGRRSRRRSKRTGLKAPSVGTGVFWLMVVLTVAAVGFSAHRMRLASLMSGSLMLGAPAEEVRYLRGEPTARSADGRHWFYTEGAGAVGVVRFDTSGRTDAISCLKVEAVAAGCPALMGVTLDTTEDQLVNRLGPANDQRYIDGGKQMYYAELGLMFTMREFRVVGITKVERSGRLGFLSRLAWNLLP
jgi:hypothetical protein